MRIQTGLKVLCSIVAMVALSAHAYSQCNFITPPAVKNIQYANRQITFSDVTINGRQTTYLAVNKGESVTIKTMVKSAKNGNYCPDCIVQVYWGIHGLASVCAKSFHGYRFRQTKSTLKFNAPAKDGIYYVTMGGTLDYSCKNNPKRPRCEAEYAFAVIKVGNPDPEQSITLKKQEKSQRDYLQTSLVKSGCYGTLDQVSWQFNGEPLPFDNQKEIPLNAAGTYTVTWSNCWTSTSRSYIYDIGEAPAQQSLVQSTVQSSGSTQKATPVGSVKPGEKAAQQSTLVSANFAEVSNPTEEVNTPGDEDELEQLVANNDKFILEHLVFGLGQSSLTMEAKAELDKLAKIMNKNPTMKILLEGHTDVRGSARKNLKLSQERVEAARDYLTKLGLSAERIATKGWGQRKPLIITDDVEKGKINRRVEVSILSR